MACTRRKPCPAPPFLAGSPGRFQSKATPNGSFAWGSYVVMVAPSMSSGMYACAA